VLAVLALTHLIQVAAFALQYRMARNQPGVAWWLAWSGSAALGFLLGFGRGIPGLQVPVIVGQNTFVLWGVLFLYVGVTRFLGHKEHRGVFLSLLVGIPVVWFALVVLDDDIVVRGVIFCAFQTGLAFLLARRLLRDRSPALSAPATFTAVFFVLHGTLFLVRGVFVTFDRTTDDLFLPTLLNTATLLDAVIVSLSGSFGLLMMHNRRLQLQAQEAATRFQTIFNLAPDAVLITGVANGQVIDVNRAFSLMSGYSREDALTNSSMALQPWKDPAARDVVARQLRETGSCQNHEAVFLRRDGSELVGLISARLLVLDGKPAILSVVRDITHRKQAEDELRRRNDELSWFSSTVAHDLKSPLITVSVFARYLEADLASGDTEAVSADLGFIRTAASKMGQRLEELVRLARAAQPAGEMTDVALQDVVADALDLVAGQVATGNVAVDVTPQPVVLRGDRERLVEVFQNLLDNATKFMGDQAAPRIQVGVEPCADPGRVVVTVQDNGRGLTPGREAVLFESHRQPSTGGGVKGCGLGLAIARRLVEAHGGRIWAESAGLGSGTTFKMALPGLDAGHHQDETALRPSRIPSGTVEAA
jgi:PAS domain S-box-containing protein